MSGGISWKWLAGILIALVITFGGYTYKETDRIGKANAEKIARLDVELQQEKVRNDIHYTEIQRQLAQLQRGIDELKQLMQNRRF